MRSFRSHLDTPGRSCVRVIGLVLTAVLAILYADDAAAEGEQTLTANLRCRSQVVSVPPGVTKVIFEQVGPTCVCANTRNEIVSYILAVGRAEAQEAGAEQTLSLARGRRATRSVLDYPLYLGETEPPPPYGGGTGVTLAAGQEHKLQVWCYTGGEIARYRREIRQGQRE
jgi:hypothetical protein